jgi:uncharacterized membrane protein YfcA
VNLLPELAFLAGAGVLAGAVGSAGGVTSLIAYPALLVAGLSPLQANVTNSVAFVACLPGSALGSQPELRGQARRLLGWALPVTAGGAAGVALLLAAPAGLFTRIVPSLLMSTSLIVLLQPRIAAWQERLQAHSQERHQKRREKAANPRFLLPCGLFALALYDGYFGAGAGVMLLTLLLLTVDRDVPRANALKNITLGMADVISAAGFAVFGPVRWVAVAPMGAGLLVGSTLGPTLTRRLNPTIVRVLAAFAGLALAIALWV